MRSRLVLLTLCAAALPAAAALPPSAAAQPAATPTDAAAPAGAADSELTLSPAEQAFAKAMAGATLDGSFTLSDRPDAKPRAERYDLGQVRKVGEGMWLIPARIRYGDHDVELPITLPVDFAGDTAVIRVDNLGFPGLGVYSARVMIHGGKYAGYWQGAGHGGHLFGELKHNQPADEAPAVDKPAAKKTEEQATTPPAED